MATIHCVLTRQPEESVAAFKSRCAEAMFQTRAPNDFAIGRFAVEDGVLVQSTEWGGFFPDLPSETCIVASYQANEARNAYYAYDQFELDAAPINPYLPLNTEMVFSDAPEPMGMFWRNLCNEENSLAYKLLEQPPGACVATEDRVWFLRQQDRKRVLCNAPWSTYDAGFEPDDIRSRHDIDLEWVDISEDELEDEATTVNHLNNAFQAHLCREDSPVYLAVKNYLKESSGDSHNDSVRNPKDHP